MSGTPLYRALVHAGAPEEEAKEAAAEIDMLEKDISEIKIMLAELRIMVRVLVVLVVAILIKSFF